MKILQVAERYRPEVIFVARSSVVVFGGHDARPVISELSAKVNVPIVLLPDGSPARDYVSGYLETIPPEGQEKLVGADASHAWFSLFVPDTGWVDLDPTNNLIPDERHVTLAWGRDYGDVTPVKGIVMGGGVHHLSVMVDVAPQK